MFTRSTTDQKRDKTTDLGWTDGRPLGAAAGPSSSEKPGPEEVRNLFPRKPSQ